MAKVRTKSVPASWISPIPDELPGARLNSNFGILLVLVVSSRIRNLVPTASVSQSQLKMVLAHGWGEDQQGCPRIRKKWV